MRAREHELPTPTCELHVTAGDFGRTTFELVDDDGRLCRVTIDRFELNVGGRLVRMDGIGNVFTPEHRRGRGYARTLLDICMQHMRAGDAHVAALYGIDDFYDRLGYASCGDEHWISFEPTGRGELPAGWGARHATVDDLPAIAAIYDATAATTEGAALRPADGRTWSYLRATLARAHEAESPAASDDCRIVVDDRGEVCAYLWRGTGMWMPDSLTRRQPDAFVLAEVMARDLQAAHAAIVEARRWARAASPPDEPHQPLTGAPPGHLLHEAARDHAGRCCVERRPTGGFMAALLRDDCPHPRDWYMYLPDRF